MTSVHAYSAGQRMLDAPSSGFRRGRAGAANLHSGTKRQLRRALRRRPGIVIATVPDHLRLGPYLLDIPAVSRVSGSHAGRYRGLGIDLVALDRFLHARLVELSSVRKLLERGHGHVVAVDLEEPP